MFPQEKDPSGGTLSPISNYPGCLFLQNHVLLRHPLDPSTWTESELRRWLKVVSATSGLSPDTYADCGQRNLEASSNMTRKELVERVEANMRPAKV